MRCSAVQCSDGNGTLGSELAELADRETASSLPATLRGSRYGSFGSFKMHLILHLHLQLAGLLR